MEYDIFGNAVIDSRSLTRKRIDELWDKYCELFDTYITFDNFSLNEDDMYGIMLRSIEDKVDYLSRFILSDDEDDSDEIIKFISGGNNVDLFKKVYTSLSLHRFNTETQYMILKMIHDKLEGCDEDKESFIDTLINDINKMNSSDLIKAIDAYQWYPDELLGLQELRDSLLKDSDYSVDYKSIEESIEKVYSIIQVTNYKYIGRKKLLDKYYSIRDDIKEIYNKFN